MSSRRSPHTVVSLFSGCGGSSLGYKLAGLDVRLAVEWWDKAIKVYRANHPDTPMHEGDVAELSVDRALELARVEPGELDILDGSPPCQGFSTAGKRFIDDPRNNLFREYVRLLEGLRPKVLVMENVSGMVKGKMKLTFVECLRSLKAAGYRVSCRLLNAMYFGVPQSRQRVIFVGVRDDLGVEPSHPRAQTRPISVGEALGADGFGLVPRFLPGAADTKGFQHPDPVFSFDRPSPTDGRAGMHGARHKDVVIATRSQPINPWIDGLRPAATICKSTQGYQAAVIGHFSSGWNAEKGKVVHADKPSPSIMRGGIDGSSSTQFCVELPAAADDDPLAYMPAPPFKGKVEGIARDVVPGGKGSDVTNGSYFSLVRNDSNRPAQAIQRTCFNGQPRVIHHAEVRGLSIGELRRLQSFPDDYSFDGLKWADAWGCIGNSVPPLMMRAIAIHIRDEILAKL